MPDSLAAASAAGHSHGLVSGLVIAAVVVLTAVCYAWLLHAELRRIRPTGRIKLVVWE